MSVIVMDILIIVLGAFFGGLLIYGFYIVLKPASKSMNAKNRNHKPSLR
jgi:hypothetical protein